MIFKCSSMFSPKRQLMLTLSLGLFLSLCMSLVSATLTATTRSDHAIAATKPVRSVKLELHTFQNKKYVSLAEMKLEFPLQYQYSDPEGTIQIEYAGDRFYLLRGTTIISRNGIYLPLDATPRLKKSGKTMAIFVPLDVVVRGMGLERVSQSAVQLVVRTGGSRKQPEDIFANAAFKRSTLKNFDKATAKQLADYLSFLTSPITGAKLSTRDSHLPGASRPYRNGVHEGIDWYSGFSGVKMSKATPVKSSARGVVVRVDSNFVELKNAERNELLAISKRAKQTPAYILDKLRGRTVWVQYEQGVLVRYAHLNQVNPSLRIGTAVKTGDWIGNVGNSGTSSGVAGNNDDLHLHMDIVIDGKLFWQHLSRAQIREFLEEIF